MDDHHDQPVWPMVQGAANYAWNLIEEAVAMVWNPVHEPRAYAVRDDAAGTQKAEREMQEVNRGATIAGDEKIAPKS
jgi:hypothetical protein